ncbi:Slc25a34, partial [Symbiodinium microadriaticum]
MSDTFARFVASALGATIAETALPVTLPTDVVKVRLQVQQSGKYGGFLDCLLQTARQEGPTALWKGLAPALLRQISYTSLSLVIYEPIREFYVKALHGGAAQ